MKPKEKVFDDIARMAGGAVSIFSGLTRQIKDEIRARVDEMAARVDLVPREDLDRVETVLMETRRRLDALEKRVSGKSEKTASKKRPRGKIKS